MYEYLTSIQAGLDSGALVLEEVPWAYRHIPQGVVHGIVLGVGRTDVHFTLVFSPPSPIPLIIWSYKGACTVETRSGHLPQDLDKFPLIASLVLADRAVCLNFCANNGRG